jgi:anti-sigma regulatory factor (Ser/Thr protein kinase)
MSGISKTRGRPPFYAYVQNGAQMSQKHLRFAISFADEIRPLIGKLNINAGEIEIPNGRDWLAREILYFAQTLVDVLFSTSSRVKSLSFWKDDLVIGLKEALANSFVHVEHEDGKVWVRWRTTEEAVTFEVVDEGANSFDLYTESSGKVVLDAFGEPLSGRGIGMSYIRRCADEADVIPIMTQDESQIRGHRVVLTKYFEFSPTTSP